MTLIHMEFFILQEKMRYNKSILKITTNSWINENFINLGKVDFTRHPLFSKMGQEMENQKLFRLILIFVMF
jgi:hypothetical protein